MKTKKKIYDASRPPVRVIYFLLVNFLKLVAVFLMRARLSKDPAIKKLEGPVIALGNHPSFLDPVYMAMAFWPRHVHFVTSSTFYRVRFVRFILQASRTIPKVQFRTDTQAVKHMLKVVHKNGVLGIYPEGQRSINGSMLSIDGTITRFIKKTGCSIVIVHVKGAYLSWPRWSDSWIRMGKVFIETKVLLRANQVMRLDERSIESKIYEALSYNEYAWQSKKRIKYYSPAPARGLHHLCHKCPSCGKDLAMRSKNFLVACEACGFSLRVDLRGFLHPLSSDDQKIKLPATPFEWHIWQVNQMVDQFSHEGYTLEQKAELQVVNKKAGKFQRLSHGKISFDEQGIMFTSDANEPVCHKKFPVLNRGGFIASFGKHFELVLADEVYRFLPDLGQSVILFADAIRAVQIIRSQDSNSCVAETISE